jgi:hypothetical protein
MLSNLSHAERRRAGSLSAVHPSFNLVSPSISLFPIFFFWRFHGVGGLALKSRINGHGITSISMSVWNSRHGRRLHFEAFFWGFLSLLPSFFYWASL